MVELDIKIEKTILKLKRTSIWLRKRLLIGGGKKAVSGEG
jgi:hypothetical protein